MTVKLIENREQVDRILSMIHNEANHIHAVKETAEEAVNLTIKLTQNQFLQHGSNAPLFNPENPELQHQWLSVFTMIAKSVLSIRLRIDVWSRTGFVDLLMKKHEAYGAEPITKWGMLGIIIRIDSKWQRYVNQMKKPFEDRRNDSMEDTLTDILGYCILGIALVETFNKRYDKDEVKMGPTRIVR